MIKSIRHNDSIQYINIPTPIYLDSCVESVKYRRTDQTDCTILSCTRKKKSPLRKHFYYVYTYARLVWTTQFTIVTANFCCAVGTKIA